MKYELGVKIDEVPTLIHLYRPGTAVSLCGRLLRPPNETEARLPRCWGCKAQAMIEGSKDDA